MQTKKMSESDTKKTTKKRITKAAKLSPCCISDNLTKRYSDNKVVDLVCWECGQSFFLNDEDREKGVEQINKSFEKEKFVPEIRKISIAEIPKNRKERIAALAAKEVISKKKSRKMLAIKKASK